MSLKAVFFCGHQSRYGLAHLQPLLESPLEILAVVIATEDRWTAFRRQLAGRNEWRFPPYRDVPQMARSINASVKRLFVYFRRRLLARSLAPSASVEQVTAVHSVPLLRVDDVNAPLFVDRIRDLSPDLLLCAAYPQIFSTNLLATPATACVNFHPSALPRCRGAHPHFWCLVKGEEESGVSAHLMTGALDQGDIVAQIRFRIGEYDYAQLYDRIVKETPELVTMVAEFFLVGDRQAVPQDAERATHYRNDREIHRRIFWSKQDATAVVNLTRTLAAFCFFRSSRLAVRRASHCDPAGILTNDVNVEPGTVVHVDEGGVTVAAREGCVVIVEVQHNGRRMTGVEWYRRCRGRIGEKLS